MSLSLVLACSGKIGGMTSLPNLDQLNPEQLRALAAQLIQRVETMDKQITHHKSVNEKLAHEFVLLKRFKCDLIAQLFGNRSATSLAHCVGRRVRTSFR